MAFLRNILFCLSDVLLQRYDSANRQPILVKTLFTQLAFVRGVLGNKCAGQYNLKTLQIRKIMWK